MKLGLSSYAYRWSIGFPGHENPCSMSLVEFLEQAIHFGFDGVQICDNLPIYDLPVSKCKAIKNKLLEQEMFIETGGRGLELSYIKKLFQTSYYLGAELVRVVAEIEDRRDENAVRRKLDHIIQSLKTALPLAKDMGLKIAIENHATLNSSDILYIVQTVDDESLGVCIDTMNSILQAEHPTETARTLAFHALTVHLKDFTIAKLPGHFQIEGVALGDGIVDFPQIISLLRKAGKYPTFHVELYLNHAGHMENLKDWEDECVQRSFDYVRNRLHY
jgi:sugar phosphate isomerase/epimerase